MKNVLYEFSVKSFSDMVVSIAFALISLSCWANPDSFEELIFEQKLIAINLSLAGTWEGTVKSINPDTGEATVTETRFTRIVTNDNGLNFATVGSNYLLWEIYAGGGVYRTSIYQFDGESTEVNLYVGDLEGPDTNGNSSHTWTYIDADGYEIRNLYTLKDGNLGFTGYRRKYGSGDEFIQVSTGAHVKKRHE